MVVAVALVLGVGVGEDVVGLVHPAARTAARITTANVPAKNDFFHGKPSSQFVSMLVKHSRSFRYWERQSVIRSPSAAIRAEVIR